MHTFAPLTKIQFLFCRNTFSALVLLPAPHCHLSLFFFFFFLTTSPSFVFTYSFAWVRRYVTNKKDQFVNLISLRCFDLYSNEVITTAGDEFCYSYFFPETRVPFFSRFLPAVPLLSLTPLSLSRFLHPKLTFSHPT